MVENVADDDVEPKPAKIEASGVGVDSGVASGDVKPTLDVKFNVKISFQAHIEEKPKPVPKPMKLCNLNRLCGFI